MKNVKIEDEERKVTAEVRNFIFGGTEKSIFILEVRSLRPRISLT
jgi:hypothetical protein